MNINFDAVTVQDCIDMYELKEMTVLLDNGKVAGFNMAGTRGGGQVRPGERTIRNEDED